VYQTGTLIRAMFLGALAADEKGDESEISIHCRSLSAPIIALTKRNGSGRVLGGQKLGALELAGRKTQLTAHVLSALVESGDRSNPSAPDSLRSLSKRARGNAWNSTRKRRWLIHALCGYIDRGGRRA